MRNSLQEELLRAGLVTKEQVSETGGDRSARPGAAPGKGGAARRRRRGGKAGGQGGKAAAERSAPATPNAPAAASRSPVLEEQRRRSGQVAQDLLPQIARAEREGPERERRRQLQRLAETHGRNDPAASIAHHFVRANRVKRIYVTAEQHAALAAGTLAIVGFGDRHHVVDLDTLERMQAIDPRIFALRAEPDPSADAPPADDPYAEYPVPDDLMW
jgi:uncharacterized protein